MRIWPFFKKTESPLIEEEIKTISKVSFDKGYEEGYREGLKKGEDEGYRRGWNECLDNIEREMRFSS